MIETTNECMEYFMGNYGLTEKSLKNVKNGYNWCIQEKRKRWRKRLVNYLIKKMKIVRSNLK